MNKNTHLVELSARSKTDYGRTGFTTQCREQRVFSSVWALESRVISGGFAEFLAYEEPELVSFTDEPLQTIGAKTCASMFARAVALAPNRKPDEITDELDSITNEF
jgi:hypothetical protein